MARGRNHILSHWDSSQGRDFGGNLLFREQAPLAWFCSLRKFDFDHFNRIFVGEITKLLVVEVPIISAHAELRGSHLENQITAFLQVVLGVAPFAGIHQRSR